ncbi:MAG: hypothetical protein Q4E53_00445 [Eubacteriales bacterium]|nr:hypothetical protein [Eubacteriales bacterium]
MLAYYMPYGNEENTIEYTKEQLQDPSLVKELFDYCHIYEGYITYEGWLYLIEIFGYDFLFEMNQESGWFDCKDLESYISQVNYEMNLARMTSIDECGNIW